MAYRPYHVSQAEGRGKMDAKWDASVVKVVTDWIKKATGASFAGTSQQDVTDTLKDGQTLCNLANKIQPGSIRKINKMKMPFMMMENIGFFVDFMKAYGVNESYIFVTVDLYEASNLWQVIIGLRALKDKASSKGFRP